MKLPAAITSKVGRQILVLKKNSPHIAFGLGITGAVASTVMACKATLHLEEVITPHEADRAAADATLNDPKTEYTQEMHDRDIKIIRVRIARDVAKLYAPSVVLGAVSIGLLTGAHVTLTKRNAALAAAYGVLDKAFREYRERVVNELGEEKDREFAFGSVDKEIVEEDEHGHKVKTVKRVAGKSGYARVFDEYNPCWSNSAFDNRQFLMTQQSWLNDKLAAQGHLFLNDVYDLLHMERSEAGAVVGWLKDTKTGDGYVDFGLFKGSDPVINDFMNLEHNDGIMIDFNVDGVIYDQLKRKY